MRNQESDREREMLLTSSQVVAMINKKNLNHLKNNSHKSRIVVVWGFILRGKDWTVSVDV